MVREVPAAPETQFQPPLVVIRGTCAIPGEFATLPTRALPTLFIERSDPRTERDDAMGGHVNVVDAAELADVGP